MRSYFAHLETAMGDKKKAIPPRPVFRASAIFPVFNMPGISSRILFMGYWILKRHIKQIAAAITLRSEKGEVIHRSTLLIEEPRTYRIELTEQLAASGVSPEITFVGSLEVEFFSTTHLVFPYPAVAINYYGPQFSSVVHTAQRVYNDFDDMQNNSQTSVPESGFNIYASEEQEPFIGLINGPLAVPDSKIKMKFVNSFKEILEYELDIGTLLPYQTQIIYPARLVDLKHFLKGKVGSAKLYFHVNWIFPRLVVGNIQHDLPAITITHTYYDCSKAESDSDYWLPTRSEWYPASLMVPACILDEQFTNIYFYPIYPTSSFGIDVEIYNSDGKLLGVKQQALSISSPSQELKWIDLKALCEKLNISPSADLAARIIVRATEGQRVPARIKLALDVGYASRSEMPCNICANLQPFNPAWETKPSTFRWSPILADQPAASLWIMNSSPAVEYQKIAKVELTFFHEKDAETIKRQLQLAPHGFAVIRPSEDPELQAFFEGQVGWCTAVSSNPYTTNYYFSHNPSGVVGGDHGF